ncbi:HYR domain-containing protein [Maribacter sp. 2308TA10-17]|uniref:Ig-like domain-containing protein n=1 Tax=Maribacter sp. 2308TA10-17 TaxID=3386276 RepID=UPI0039BD0549
MPHLLKQIFVVLIFFGFTSHIVPKTDSSKSIKANVVNRIDDSTASLYVPTFSNCPSNISNIMPVSGDCTAVVTWTPPTASGSGPITMTSNYNPGDSFFPGTHRVIYRATDSNGTSFCEFTVEVLDIQAPVITVPSDITVDVDPGSCGAVVTFPFPQATDNCPAGTGESPLEQDFDGGEDFSQLCYEFIGTLVGTQGLVNGSNELETFELVNFDTRIFKTPLTRFNGDGDILFDHRLLRGVQTGNLNNHRPEVTVKLINTSGGETVIYNYAYTDEVVQNTFIPITLSGNYYVQFEFDANRNRNHKVVLDDLYIPGFVVADEGLSGSCPAANLRVSQIGGFPYRSNVEFPVGTTTLRYFTEDASGNIAFNQFNVTVNNNINAPAGSSETYCEGTAIPELSVTVGPGQTADWYANPSGTSLLLADSTTYTPTGPGTFYVETRNPLTGCVSSTRTPITLIQNPQPSPPATTSPIEYCVNDSATALTALGDPGNMIRWYDAATGGTLYPSAPVPNTTTAGTTSYYVEQEDAGTGCISNRTQVDVIVHSLPLAPSITSPVEYCIGDISAQLDSHATGTNLRWYTAASGGTEIPGTTQPNTSIAGQQFFWVTQSAVSGSTNCESARTRLTVNVNTAPAISANPTNQTICPNGNVSFTATASNTSTYQWQEFGSGIWSDLAEASPYSNTTTTTLNINGATLGMNGNQYRMVASSAAATCSDAISNPATLTVEDNTPPVLAGCPTGPIAANSTAGSCGALVTWTPPTATDDCGSATITSNGYSPGDEFLPGTTTVIYTATDGAGNTDTCSFDVIVTDNVTPELTGPANTTVQANNAGCTAIVNYTDPVAADNCVMSTGEYPVATDFEVPSRNDLIAECWIFFGSDVSNSSALAGSRSFRTSEVEPGQTRGLVSPLMYFNGTGEIGFIHRLQNFPNDITTVRLFTEDEAGNIDPTPFYTYTYTDLNLHTANAPISFSGNYRIRFEFDTDIKRNTSKRIRMDNLTIPGIKLSDPSNGCAPAEFNIIQTAGLASGSTFPIGTTTNTFEVTDTYGNTDSYSFDITVENNLTVTANVTDTEVCQGESVTLTGSGAQSYSWDNGVTNGVPFTINSTTTFTVTGTDANGCQDTDSITVTVNPNPTITVTSAPACSTDLSTYSLSVSVSNGTVTSSEGTVTNTGGNDWTISNITSGNNITVTVTDSNTCSENIAINAPNCGCPTVNAPTSGGNQTECEANPIQTLTAMATPPSGASISWYDAATGGNTVASATLNTVGTITYFAESVDNLNGCTSSTRTPVTLTIQDAPLAPASGGDQTECEASPTQTLTATATSGAGKNIVWYDAASGGNTVASPTLNSVGTVTYYAESRDDITSCPSFSRTAVTLTIQPNPTAPTSGGNQTQCEANPIQTLTATATAPAGSSVIWYDASSGGSVVPGPTLNTVGTITYYAESQNGATSCVSNTRTPVTLTIQDTPTISETPSSASCSLDLTTYSVSVDVSEGTVTSSEGTVVDNGGNNWTISGITSGNNITATVTALNSCSDIITITAPNCSCPIVNAPTSGGDQTQCEASPIQTLTATATPPSGATVVWYDAASGGNVVASPTLNSVGTATYYAESVQNVTNCVSSTRTAVALTIQATPTNPVSGGDQTQCETSPIQTLTATATAPVDSSIVWYDAASGGNVVASPTLNSVGTVTYYAESSDDTSSCVSFARTPVVLTIQDTPDITISNAPTCAPDLLTYTVSVDVSEGTVTSTEGTVIDNGGNNWTISGITSGNNITLTVTAPNACAQNLAITAPNCSCPVVNAPTSGGNQTECEASPVQTLTANATAPVDATVVWYDAASGGNVVASPTLNTVGTATYFAESRDNITSCTSSTRTAVVLTIQATPANPISGGDQTQCEASPIQTLTATATVPVGSTVVWYDAASGGNVIASPTLNTVGTITYFAESSDDITSCVSFARTPVILTIEDTPDITISSAPTCAPDLLTYAVSVNVSEGTVTSTEGTVIDNGGNNWTISGITSGNNITLTVAAPNTCAQTLAITAPNCSCPVVNAPTNGGNQTECESSPIQTLTATATAPVDATVVWYDAASGGNVVASPTLNTVGTATYFAESVQNVTNCVSSTRTAVALTIQATPTNPVSGGDQTQCETSPIQTLTAAANAPVGSSVIWYDSASGGNVIASPTLNSVGTITYFAESSDDTSSCVSFARTPVVLTINALPSVIANASTITINAGEPVTLTGSGATSYVWDNGVTDGDTVFPLVTTTYTVIGTDGNTCENTDSVTITVGATSDIRLEKTVDVANPNVGDTVIFTLTATNDGPSDDVGGSIVHDPLPIGYTYTSDTGNATNGTYDNVSGNWTLPALTNGSSSSITISATVNTPTGTANEYSNVAQVTFATNFDSDSAPNNDDGDQSEDDEAAVAVTPQVADLEVTNSISQPTANPGDALTLTADILNNGPNDATNVSLENVVPSGFTVTNINDGGSQSGNVISWSGLNIPNGTTATVTFEVTVNNPVNIPDEYLNTVQVTTVDQFDADSAPNNDDGDQSEDDEDNILLILQSTDLEIVNTVTPDSGNPGDTLTFTVEVINNGTDDATNVAIENVVPSGFTITSINNGGTQTANTISWSGLNIPNGTSSTLSFEVTINVPTNTMGEYLNTVQIIAVDQLDPDSTPNNDDGDQSEDDEDNAEIVLIPADLSLNKTLSAASNPSPNAGDTVTFELTLTNEGPGIATNVIIEDTLPIGYTLGTVNDGGTVSGNVISWDIPNMPVGSQTLSYEVTLNTPTNAVDEYTNVAQIIASDQFDPDSTPNNDDGDQSEDDEISHMIDPPTVDLEINKTVDKQQTFFEDTIVFTVTATNNSSYDATNIGIEDILPSGYILVSTSADTGTYNETTFTWEIPFIAIGTTASLEMTVTVTDVEDYTNIAQLIYVDQIDLNLDNDRAEATPEITQSECLTVFNEFSPNGDGANDVFFIECIEQYPDNILQVFNRWGVKVFEMRNYDNSWNGTSMGRVTTGGSQKLPVGTYYYTLQLGESQTPPKSGWLYISR